MPKVTEEIVYVPGQDEMVPDSHTYVIGKPASKDLTLIDPGLIEKGSYKLQSIKKAGIELSSIKRVLVTHTHLDHIGAIFEIRKELPGVELWMHTSEADPLEQGDERTLYGMDFFREGCQAQYHLKPGAYTLRTDRKLQGDEILELGGMTWEVIHLPGHSMGCIGFYNRSTKILIPGDVVYADHSIGRFDLYGADAADHKKSLHKLAELEVDMLLPGHNEIVKKVPKGYLRETLKQWESYLD